MWRIKDGDDPFSFPCLTPLQLPPMYWDDELVELRADVFVPEGWSLRRVVCVCVWAGGCVCACRRWHIYYVSRVHVYAPFLLVCLYESACKQRWTLKTTAWNSLPFLWPNWISPTLIFKGPTALLPTPQEKTHTSIAWQFLIVSLRV